MEAASYLSRHLNGSLPYVRRDIIVNKTVLSASLNKTFPYFLPSLLIRMYCKVVAQHSKLPLWVTSVGYLCGVPLWGTSVGYLCGLPLWVTSVGYLCGLPLWVTSVGYLCGQLSSEVLSSEQLSVVRKAVANATSYLCGLPL